MKESQKFLSSWRINLQCWASFFASLAENEINVEAIGVFQDSAKIYTKNLNKAIKVLNKLNYTTDMRDVLLIHLDNRPGALGEVATRIGDEGINIEYCYGTLSQTGDRVAVIMDVSNIDRAMKVLESSAPKP